MTNIFAFGVVRSALYHLLQTDTKTPSAYYYAEGVELS
jgi:hypothetical protein